jgi:hypothetical protein
VKLPWQKRASVILAVFVAAAAIRSGIILYERRQSLPQKQAPEASYQPTADDYVYRRKIYADDVKSAASELRGKAVWVAAGNQLPYYPYSAATHHVDFRHEAGLLPPLEKLEITDVMFAEQPPKGSDTQVMAIFQRQAAEEKYAVSIGAESNGNYRFIANDIFFLDDPHILYNYWPADIWTAIDRHEVKPGMNELQAGFALGTAARASPGQIGDRTVKYANAGKPVKVTFVNNRAVEVTRETQP